MSEEYDVAIVGGGLSGLSAAIMLRRYGYSVALFEKEKYPFNKVCGEYVSMESWDFLQSLGLPLQEFNLPRIKKLFLTAANGKAFKTNLPLGGFGISRYRLDASLAAIAKQSGVAFFEEAKVENIQQHLRYVLNVNSKLLGKIQVQSKICCGAYGKRSNLDIKWKRAFVESKTKRLNNYVGVKYHIKSDWESNVIGLHNFSGGYCGISQIEDEKFCLCYMTTAENLKKNNNDLGSMEKNVLFRNPHLKKIFSMSEFLPDFPVTISQISFQKKTTVENGVLMLGDAAGMITPLSGNGMSIALHTGKIAANVIHQLLQEKISKQQMLQVYSSEWEKHFAGRLKTGRAIQYFFGSEWLSNFFVNAFRLLPFLASPVIRMTHGKPSST